MDLDTLNFLKKPEEVKVIKSNVYPFRKTHIYIGKITPTRAIQNRCIFELTHVDESMILEGFIITTYLKEDQIISINVFGDHPNCNTDTNTYCWPDHKKGLVLDQDSLSMMITNFKTYYLDDCYFTPGPGLIHYKKLNSMSIHLNKGDS